MQRSNISKLIKNCLLGFAIASQCTVAYSIESPSSSSEEAFLIRRIAEFWKDGDFSIVKTQIKDFIQKYPSSSMHDYLHGILGDLLIQENNFVDALAAYKAIADSSITNKVILNKLQCYYELDDFSSLQEEGEQYLSYTSDEFESRKNEYHFVMAESYFRQALLSEDQDVVKELAAKARPFYEELLDTEYGEVSSFALAEVYKTLGQNAKGADLYLVLAERYPEKKENLLFNAAILEANLDKHASIQIFDRVIDMRGSKAPEASYNRLLLYYQTNQFDNVISNHRLVYPHVAENQLGTFNYVVAKSFYALEDYDSAVSPMQNYLVEQDSASDQFKDALLVQLTCAKQLSDESLFDKTLTTFKEYYPDDKELGKALFMHAMLLKKEGDLPAAEEKLRQVVEKYSDFDDQESLLYEYSVLTHQNEKFDTSYQMFKNFLSQFPESERTQSAWRYFLSSCLHLSKEEKTDESTGYSQDVFLSDLQKVLSNDNGLSSDEIREYKLLYAKLAYEQSYYNESLETLSHYVKDYAEHETLAEAHVLTALSLNKLNSDLEGFCDHLETAIKLNPNKYDTSLIHLQLYNAYITRAQNQNNDAHLTELAADYLYIALQDANNTVKLENKLWLAGHYFKKVSTFLEGDWTRSIHDSEIISIMAQRAEEVYGSAILTDNGEIISINNEENLYLEPEILKYTKLLGYSSHKEEKIEHLKSLIEMQNQNTALDWSFKRQALYELASTYEDQNDYKDALDSYEFIANHMAEKTTPITCASKLKSATIKFSLLDKNQYSESDPAILGILNQLKELQIKKNALSEPIHLEGAFNYARIRSELSAKNLKASRYLFFLTRMKEDYESKDDALGIDYHNQLQENPAAAALYKSYLTYINAEILRMQAKQLLRENKKVEAQEKKQMAYSMLTELENSNVPTKFLKSQINRSLKKLK